MTDRVLLTSKMPETGSSCLVWKKLIKTELYRVIGMDAPKGQRR